MPLNHALIGVDSEPAERSWTATEAILYALGVGAGLGDPTSELEFTTENSMGITKRVLPTFGVILARGQMRSLGDFNPAMLVHAEQGITVHGPIPVEGTVRATSKVTGIYDKGSGALVQTESCAVLTSTGKPLVTTTSAAFIRGEGGFSGDRGPTSEWQKPQREPDYLVTYETRPEQALLYRLSGDRNPLHSDPTFAARGGFTRPILHGLCTYGVTGRALLHLLCGTDPARFGSMHARFTRPVMPGDSLTVSIWSEGAGALFQTAGADGMVVLDHGRFSLVKED